MAKIKLTESAIDTAKPQAQPVELRDTLDRNIIQIVGRMKVQDVKRADVATMMKKLDYKPGRGCQSCVRCSI